MADGTLQYAEGQQIFNHIERLKGTEAGRVLGEAALVGMMSRDPEELEIFFDGLSEIVRIRGGRSLAPEKVTTAEPELKPAAELKTESPPRPATRSRPLPPAKLKPTVQPETELQQSQRPKVEQPLAGPPEPNTYEGYLNPKLAQAAEAARQEGRAFSKVHSSWLERAFPKLNSDEILNLPSPQVLAYFRKAAEIFGHNTNLDEHTMRPRMEHVEAFASGLTYREISYLEPSSSSGKISGQFAHMTRILAKTVRPESADIAQLDERILNVVAERALSDMGLNQGAVELIASMDVAKRVRFAEILGEIFIGLGHGKGARPERQVCYLVRLMKGETWQEISRNEEVERESVQMSVKRMTKRIAKDIPTEDITRINVHEDVKKKTLAPQSR